MKLIEKPLNLASPLPRLMAACLDLCLASIPLFLIRLFMEKDIISSDMWKLNGWALLCLFIYTLAFQNGKNAASPGKRVLGLKVMHASGRDLSFWEHFARALALCAFMPIFISLITILLNPQRRGWHDWLAETVVVKVE